MLTGNKYISEQCNRIFTDSLPSYFIVHERFADKMTIS